MTTENGLWESGLSTIEAPITWKAYLVCVSAAFGGIFFGYDIGWMSGVLGMPYVIQQYTDMEYDFNAGTPVDSSHSFAIPSSDKSLMTSILSLGTFLGAIVAGDLADLWGRRITILIGCAIFSCGVILQISSSGQLALMTIGRLAAGLGVGFESSVIILYMSEVAPRKIRGAVVSAYQFSMSVSLCRLCSFQCVLIQNLALLGFWLPTVSFTQPKGEMTQGRTVFPSGSNSFGTLYLLVPFSFCVRPYFRSA